MSNGGLTQKQQDFLNNYIRQHRLLGIKKKSDAENFARRKGKVLAALGHLPDFPELTKTYKDELAKADQLADSGNFKEAFQLLKAAKKNARKSADKYDPTLDIQQLIRDTSALCNSAKVAGRELKTFTDWLSGDAQVLAKQLADFAQDPLGMPSRGGDRSVELIEHFEELERNFWDQWHHQADLSKVTKFLGEVTSTQPKLESRATELRKGVKLPQHGGALDSVATAIARDITNNADLLPLKLPGNKYVTAGTYVEGLKQPYQTRFKELRTMFERSLEPFKKTTPELEVSSGSDIEKFHDEVFVDDQNVESRRHDTELPKFDTSDFFGSFKMPKWIDKEYPPEDPSRERLKKVVKNLFATELANTDVDSDEFFDLQLKSKKELMEEYAKSCGLGSDPSTWTKAQQAIIESTALGMLEAVVEKAPNKFDPASGKLMIGGVEYGNAKVLGKGGVGTAIRYENLSVPGQFVVLKTSYDLEGGHFDYDLEREVMAKELRNHKQVMSGDSDETGRKNVVEMKGSAVGPDGSLFVLMEVADGGDVEKSKGAMVVASEIGSLPEEARNVLNQYLTKQALQGLAYVRDRNMVHFDLKEENLFMMSDGTLKIADFGGSSISDNPEGKVTVDQSTGITQGYAPRDVIDAMEGKEHPESSETTKSDMFSMGRVVQNLHTGGGAKHDWGTPILPKDLTGALGRLSDAMTDKSPDERVTIEGALDSSYIQNLDNYDHDTLRQLMQAIVAYGKCLKGDEIKPIKFDIDKCRENIQKFETQLKDSSLSPTVREKIDKQWREERNKLEGLLKQLQKLTDTPEAKVLAEEIKLLSQQLIRPSGSRGTLPPKERQEFFDLLNKTASDPKAFVKLLALPSNLTYFKEAGVSQVAAIQAFRPIDDLDLSERNPQAFEQLEATGVAFDTFVKSVKHRDMARAFRKAADVAMRYLGEEFDACADQRVNQTLEKLQNAKQEVIEQLGRANDFLQGIRVQTFNRLGAAQKASDDSQDLAKQVLGQIAIGFPPRIEGPTREFAEYAEKIENVKGECEGRLRDAQQTFAQMLPAQELIEKFRLTKQKGDVSNLLMQIAHDIDSKCYNYTHWMEQARDAALGALKGEVAATDAFVDILNVDVKKLFRDEWPQVGGIDSRVSTAFNLVRELFDELKVLVDIK